jgi:hypothetical protein
VGLTLLEIASLKKPYGKADNMFSLRMAICNHDAPRLSNNSEYSEKFTDFLNLW